MDDFGHRRPEGRRFQGNLCCRNGQIPGSDFDGCSLRSQTHGELGNIYGSQWRRWRTTQGEFIDQISDVIEMIKTNPDSRRLMVSAWNPEDVPSMALPPCHTLFQFYVTDGKLSCQLYQRSADIFLGCALQYSQLRLVDAFDRKRNRVLKSGNSSTHLGMPIFT